MKAKDLKLKHALNIILSRLLPIGDGYNGPLYSIDENIDGGVYDKLIVNPAFEKPSRKAMNDAFDLYKAEVIEAENAKAKEQQRVQDLLDKWASIKDVRMAMNKANIKEPNKELLRDRIINSDMQDLMNELLQADQETVADLNESSETESFVSIGRDAMQKCNTAMAFMVGWDIQEKGKSEIFKKFEQVEKHLVKFEIKKAKKLLLDLKDSGEETDKKIVKHLRRILK